MADTANTNNTDKMKENFDQLKEKTKENYDKFADKMDETFIRNGEEAFTGPTGPPAAVLGASYEAAPGQVQL